MEQENPNYPSGNGNLSGKGRGNKPKPPKDQIYSKDELNNYGKQLNPTTQEYWKARGYDKRPDNWQEILKGK